MAKILLADDQLCVREFISQELKYEGYSVETVSDAESVMAHLRSSRPDLVLLDLYLDGPDGFGVLRDIKSQHLDVPVIILTAFDSYADDPLVSQADAYVIKSMILDELKEKIADVLKRKPLLKEGGKAKTYFNKYGPVHCF